jgi:gamma-glutamyltranspeptidase/glutathione hydrolase
MVAAPNPLATRTAVEVLRDGGNAVDAAVAAAAVLGVVEPHQTGIGGDCFALIAPGGRPPLIAYNGSGRAPKAASVELYRKTAIHYAEEGYPVHGRTAFDWARAADLLRKDATAARIFLPDGRPPKAGELHRQPLLAKTLRRIAAEGPRAFYEGPLAEDMVRYLRSIGGLHSLEDFAEAKGDYVDPIDVPYRGYRVCQMPPNNQGITALIMLNILSGYDLGALAPLGADRLHLEAEAGRRAYEDRNRHVADPAHAEVPVARLLSPEHADDLRAKISEEAASQVPVERLRRADTVHIAVVDEDLNAVSFINSLFHDFGSGLVAPESGILLQSRGASFRLDPDHPNCVAPGKRPMHTIMPGMLLEGERAAMAFGVVGGDYQPFGHVHFLTNLLDFGLDLQESLDLARVFHDGEELKVERGVPAESRDALARRGHRLAVPEEPLGGGQAVWIDWERGVLTGASDPRMDGCALGY